MGLMSIDFATTVPPVSDPAAVVAYWARQVSACTLVDEVAGMLGVPASLVWDALSTMPENMLTLLDSPQGWTALAGYCAAEMGVPAPDLMLRVH
jgi:hypothetical protein